MNLNTERCCIHVIIHVIIRFVIFFLFFMKWMSIQLKKRYIQPNSFFDNSEILQLGLTGGLLGWFTYKFFFSIYFIYLLHYKKSELTQIIFYNSEIKVFT